MLDFLEVFEAIKNAALPSGIEGRQADVIKRYAEPFADEIYEDRLGNLFCHKKGPGKKFMLPAHMDVIGFMATYIDEHGFIRFATVGGHAAYALPETRVRFENGIYGYIKSDDRIKADKLSDVPMTDLFIDIGAGSREEAAKYISPGTCAVFDSDLKRIADGNIMTPYADNLAGCASLLLAMSTLESSPNDLYFVFSVQEELGLRGAKCAANGLGAYMGVAIDLTRTGDSPAETDNLRMAVRVGGGPAIKIRDSSLICDRPVVEHLRKAAEGAGVTYQDEILVAGGTDSAAMQRARCGVLSGCVSIPGRNIHSPSEIINVNDAIGAAKILAAAAGTEI